ncbi:MAG TPA: hypothetical protein ENN63_03110 [Bacteroidetes bacterium]|nr:hypothetical protein [Bacteroidota bacterium]
MSYQAVIRDGSNDLLTEQTLGMRISILQGAADGTAVYTETHTPVTNASGVVTVEIGTGTTTDDFSSIDWSNGPYFLKTETDPAGGTDYTVTGTTQLLSVPYALYADTVGSYNESDPVFEAWDKNYNDLTQAPAAISDLNMDGNGAPVENVADPANPQDVATKHYVDSIVVLLMNESAGSNETFLSPDTGILTDVENNSYGIIKIGTQWWMTENLKATKYNDGDDIPLVEDYTWSDLDTPGYCYYQNDQATYGELYGALYNWHAVNTGKLCPDGWHVPSDEEWKVLTDFLGGIDVAGGKMKETGTEHWLDPNTGATNESGFTGLPGGDRSSSGAFGTDETTGHWWSSTELTTLNSWCRGLHYDNDDVNERYYYKRGGFSVRCVRD